eukprot:scaffold195003_cov21-Cyclotella_meneghiniana.AAC.2
MEFSRDKTNEKSVRQITDARQTEDSSLKPVWRQQMCYHTTLKRYSGVPSSVPPRGGHNPA